MFNDNKEFVLSKEGQQQLESIKEYNIRHCFRNSYPRLTQNMVERFNVKIRITENNESTNNS